MLLGLIIIAAVIGFSVDRGTPLNDRMLDKADAHHLPSPLGAFYTDLRQPPPEDKGECDCVVTAINGTILTAHERVDADKTVTIVLPPNDPLLGALSVGDTIFAGGNFRDGVLYSFGIRKVIY